MAKWLIWTLLEFSTFIVVVSVVLLWLSSSLKKKIKSQQSAEESTEPPTPQDEPKSTAPEEQIAGKEDYKKLVHYLDQQIAFAASSILAANNSKTTNPTLVNRFKLWGTILKAERAILLNEVSEHPKPILGRFLSSLLFAVQPSKTKERKISDLDKSLKDAGSEFFLMGERLVTKESLFRSQMMLNEDLKKNISRSTKRLEQLKIKQKEQQKLQLEISRLQNQIKALEKQQGQQGENVSSFNLQIPTTKTDGENQNHLKHPSFKQITTLNSLSQRQSMVIEQLKNELDKAHKNSNHAEAEEMKRVALSKMERMSEETQSLILQLEGELQTSNLTIASLREDLSAKEARLAEIEEQLVSNNETAISSLQTLSANKKETLGSFRHGLNNALEQGSSDNLLEQDKDAKMLERLLQESETCVTLLVQELEVSEEENKQLKQKVESILKESQSAKAITHQPLIEQREKNRQLAQITTDLKEKILEQAANSDQQELKTQYNKKSLEFDRLQLAFADLEMKYLGTLNK